MLKNVQPWVVWSYLYWGVVWLLLGFLVAELLGEYNLAPWHTLSNTVWHAEVTYWYVAPGLFALFTGLELHFFYHRPLMWSLGVGSVIAVVAHVLDAKIP